MRPLPYALETPVRAETPYGGQVTTWSPAGLVWLTLAVSAPHAIDTTDRPPEHAEAAEAHGRSDPALAPGVRLAFAGETPWIVRAIHADPEAPGRVRLLLDRLL